MSEGNDDQRQPPPQRVKAETLNETLKSGDLGILRREAEQMARQLEGLSDRLRRFKDALS